jgi:hypothetical protein
VSPTGGEHAGKGLAPGWRRTASGDDEIKQGSVPLAPDGANSGPVDPPCCHATPLSIAAVLLIARAMLRFFEVFQGSPRAADNYKSGATKLMPTSMHAKPARHRR